MGRDGWGHAGSGLEMERRSDHDCRALGLVL